MKVFLSTLALCVASSLATRQNHIAGQITLVDKQDTLCPSSPPGTVYPLGKTQYQIYCHTGLTGVVVKKLDVPGFGDCIVACNDYNEKNRGTKKKCKGVSFAKIASPQCELFDDLTSSYQGRGVKSAVLIEPGPLGGAGRAFKQVDLPRPLNWVAGYALYPYNLLQQYTARSVDYDSATWSEYVLGQCKSYSNCRTSLTFSANANGGIYWFGFLYSASPASKVNFTRADKVYKVRHSIAYTLPRN